MAICLPKTEIEKLKTALRNGEFTIPKLYEIGSEGRFELFKHYVGETFAKKVNSSFERAMLSKQKKALSRWLETTFTEKQKIRRNDMMKKVDRLDKVVTKQEESGFDFMSDLADTTLGLAVTETEVNTLFELKNNVEKTLENVDRNSENGSESRLAYGLAVVQFKDYVGGLKENARRLTFQEYVRNPLNVLYEAASFTKSLLATLDNSFYGRQGIKVLYTSPSIWVRRFAESWIDMGKQIAAKTTGVFKPKDDSVMQAIRADIYSRENALNGKYGAAKNEYGLGVSSEEAFPSSLPEYIPVLGRLFKASEVAFNGGALKMRADLADLYIEMAEENGVDVKDERQADGLGELVAQMTGRGDIGRLEVYGKEINALVFSIKFLSSNIRTLFGGAKNTVTLALPARKNMTFAQKQSAKNFMKIVMSVATILFLANLMDKDAVEKDPRSANFGKIKVGNTKIDVTGGMASLVVLASRLIPTQHKGEFGWWTKSSTTNKYTKMAQGNFGEQTPGGVFMNFLGSKLSPLAGAVRDIYRGRDFSGQKPTPASLVKQLTYPIALQNLIDSLDDSGRNMLISNISEMLGLQSGTTDINPSGVKWEKLRKEKGNSVFDEAARSFNESFSTKLKDLQSSTRYFYMTTEEQNKAVDKLKREEQAKIFKKYNIK